MVKQPCGECHLSPGETCNICGAGDPRTHACPICCGVGQVEPPKHTDETAARIIMASALRDAGYSFRQIMRLCGWKSPRSAMLAVASFKKLAENSNG